MLSAAVAILTIGSASAYSFTDNYGPLLNAQNHFECVNQTTSGNSYNDLGVSPGFPLVMAAVYTVNTAASSDGLFINASWGLDGPDGNKTLPFLTLPPLAPGNPRAQWQVITPCDAAMKLGSPPSGLQILQPHASCGGYHYSVSSEDLLTDNQEDNFGTPENGNISKPFSPQSSSLSSAFWLEVPKSLDSTDLHIFIEPKLFQFVDDYLWQYWDGDVNLTVWRGTKRQFGCGSLLHTERLAGDSWASNLTIYDVALGEWLLIVFEPRPGEQSGPVMSWVDQFKVRLPVTFQLWGTVKPPHSDGGSGGISVLGWVGIISGCVAFVTVVGFLLVWKRRHQLQNNDSGRSTGLLNGDDS